jgi:hypothetical protein
MLIVHHLQRSQSERIVWLCEELGIQYELKTYPRDKKTFMCPPELQKLYDSLQQDTPDGSFISDLSLCRHQSFKTSMGK